MQTWKLVLGLLLGALVLLGPSAPRDLDVGVPAGSPLDWTRSFPVHTPGHGPLFPRTREREATDEGEERSSARPRTLELDVQVGSSFVLMRIYTWDLAAHLTWLGPPERAGPTSGGPSLLPPPPTYGEGLFWITLAPLLRLLLHPELTPETATLAHLVEIGEPALTALDTAAGEKDLQDVVRQLQRLLGSERAREDPPLDAPTARGRMLSRFTYDELVSAYPYDPEGDFGRRLFLFAEELEPVIARYARSGSTTLRRAAVAALGRYRTKTALAALLERATTTQDPVELVRALAALSRFRGEVELEPLIERLDRASEPVERVALVRTLGRPRALDALPGLLAFGREAFKERDSDLLIVLLDSLARIALAHIPAERHAAIEEFLDDVERVALSSPSVFRSKRPGRQRPDVPDRAEMRGETLLQLCRIVRFALHSGDEVAVRDLSRLADKEAVRQRREGAHFGRVHAPARLLWIEALGRTGEAGNARLRAIASSDSHPTPLRAHALTKLPYDERTALALDMAAQGAAPEIRALGLETLLADRHPRAKEFCREILAEGLALPVKATPAQEPAAQHLLLRAVRALSSAGELSTVDLAPLIPAAQSQEDAFGSLPEEIRELIRELIALAGQGRQRVQMRERIVELVDLVARLDVNPAIDEKTREENVRYIEGQLSSVRSHRRDLRYLRLVEDAIAEHLLGYRSQGWTPRFERFAPDVAVADEILLALGRTREAAAARLLADFLGNRRNENRAIACLALGITGFREHSRLLASFLLDAEPFVRFCAHEALRYLNGFEVGIDWMHDPSEERFAAAERYLAWLLENETSERR